MVTFQVNDMTCGHCASTIAKAVAGVDKNAVTEVDIPRKLVRVSSGAPAADLGQAIQDAGYTPQVVEAVPGIQPATPQASGGCCGGGRKKASVDVGQGVAPPRSSCCG
ncbi:heavy-metal-associated domain-containing protein [uncultured Ramlibacter sp.]|uniref:heavy-metal-associated domain-containing protein n=1 Tax=uncultured Ramlibacter sp. TaxID=260755 RepID=UPI00345C20FA